VITPRALALALLCVGAFAFAGDALAAKPRKPPRAPDPMLQARAVCDSLAGVARGREGAVVSMREDRVPFCRMEHLAKGWTLVVEVADDAAPRGLAVARELEGWLRARGWAFDDACFEQGPPVRRAAFTRDALGCSFETSPLQREQPVAEGQYAPGYLLTLAVVVLEPPPPR